jgi:hypothetical protein
MRRLTESNCRSAGTSIRPMTPSFRKSLASASRASWAWLAKGIALGNDRLHGALKRFHGRYNFFMVEKSVIMVEKSANMVSVFHDLKKSFHGRFEWIQ